MHTYVPQLLYPSNRQWVLRLLPYLDILNNAAADILLPSGRYLEIELQGHRLGKFTFNYTSKFLPNVSKSMFSCSKNSLE